MRYAHAKPYKRARRQLRTLKTYLGRTIRDIRRQIDGDKALEEAFRAELWKARRVMTQRPRDDVPKKIYSLHAPEGVHRQRQVSQALRVRRQGERRHHAGPLKGRPVRRPCQSAARPYDGHTLKTVPPEIEALAGALVKRILADAGYKGHNAEAAPQAQGLHDGPKTPGDAGHQAAIAKACGGRARHRPPQERPPDGPQRSGAC